MAKRTTQELAQQLADMKWGDSLSDLEMGANEARALGRAFLALRQQLEAENPKQDDGWIEWGGGDCPVDIDKRVEVRFVDGFSAEYRAGRLDWEVRGVGGAINAYRVVS